MIQLKLEALKNRGKLWNEVSEIVTSQTWSKP